MNIGIKVLSAAIAAIAGAIGPYWMYGQAIKQMTIMKTELESTQKTLLETRLQLNMAGVLIQEQNDRVHALKAEGDRLLGKMRKASMEVSSLQDQNKEIQAYLERALVPHDAVGAMEWQREQLLKLAGEPR